MRATLLRQRTVRGESIGTAAMCQSERDGHAATLPVNLQWRKSLRQADTAGHTPQEVVSVALIGTPTRPHRARQQSTSWLDVVFASNPLLLQGRSVEDSGDTPGCRPR